MGSFIQKHTGCIMNKAIIKSQIRDNVRKSREALSDKTVTRCANILRDTIVNHDSQELVNIIGSAKTIALYQAVRGELSCDGVASYLKEQGKILCYPRVKGETMDFYQVEDLENDFTLGAYDIPEPRTDKKKVYNTDIDIIFVPAVAYTEDGARLGQGGGYYDRYLNSYGAKKRPVTIGICYDFQLYSALPVESHDYCVDYVLCIPSVED